MSVSSILSKSSSWEEIVTNSGNGNNNARDYGQVTLSYTYSNGTGSGNINQFYDEYNTLASGASRNYDLRSVTGSILGHSVTKTFSKVKSIDIKNYATQSGYNLSINTITASGFGEPFGYPSTVITLQPNSSIGHNNMFGWNVNSGDCQILINNLGTGALSYEILVLGEE